MKRKYQAYVKGLRKNEGKKDGFEICETDENGVKQMWLKVEGLLPHTKGEIGGQEYYSVQFKRSFHLYPNRLTIWGRIPWYAKSHILKTAFTIASEEIAARLMSGASLGRPYIVYVQEIFAESKRKGRVWEMELAPPRLVEQH